MSRLEPIPVAATSTRPAARGVLVLVVTGVALAFAAGALWATQGREVFFTVLAAGIAACF